MFYSLLKFLEFRGFYRSGGGNAICSFIENKPYIPYLSTNIDEHFYAYAFKYKKFRRKKTNYINKGQQGLQG